MASASFAGPAEDWIDAQLKVVQGMEKEAPKLARTADEAAQRLLDGGQLYLAGEPAIVSELAGRAGGLCGAKVFQPGKTTLAKQDTSLYSDYDSPKPDPFTAWSRLMGFGAHVVLLISNAHKATQLQLLQRTHLVGVDIPRDPHLVTLPSGERLIPAAAPALAIAQWAFVAELIGSGRRQGKQLAVYLSIHLDEGQKRFKRTQGLLFEPDLKPEPVPPGHYAKEFLGHVRTALEAVRRDEVGTIRQAAAWLREAREAKQKRVAHLYGHMAEAETLNTGPDFLFTDRVRGGPGAKSIEWIRANLHKGDVYLFLGYQQNEDAMAAAANELGARTIFLTSLPPSPEQAKSPLHLYVDPHWPLTDACLDLPGYDVKACPLSGIMGLTTYYAICAEALGGK